MYALMVDDFGPPRELLDCPVHSDDVYACGDDGSTPKGHMQSMKWLSIAAELGDMDAQAFLLVADQHGFDMALPQLIINKRLYGKYEGTADEYALAGYLKLYGGGTKLADLDAKMRPRGRRARLEDAAREEAYRVKLEKEQEAPPTRSEKPAAAKKTSKTKSQEQETPTPAPTLAYAGDTTLVFNQSAVELLDKIEVSV